LGTGLKGVPQLWQITRYAPGQQLVTVVHEGESFTVKLWCWDNEVLAVCQYLGK
jgi:hypothetical protein